MKAQQATATKHKSTVTLPNDRDVVVVRSFNAPRTLVFDAWTTPALVQRWLLGPPGWTMPERSPFTSAIKTGTPAPENPSARTCRDTVLPVPVAPVMRPWRFAYFSDVFVDPAARGVGLGRAMVRFALAHPDLALVYRWLLATDDAHGVYRALGFVELDHPERWLTLGSTRPWLDDEG